MSGGSYDYIYRNIEDVADRLSDKNHSPLRRAFAKHLKLVAEAMHDIEWVDSGDYGTGDDVKAIEAVFSDSKSKELKIVVRMQKLYTDSFQSL